MREGGDGGVEEDEEVLGPAAAAPSLGDAAPDACGEGVEWAM